MEILVPIDGSDCSERALRHAIELAQRFDAALDVVHFTDSKGSDTERLQERVSETLVDEGLDSDTEVIRDLRLGSLRSSTTIGKDILQLVDDRDYDHVVMGHHGTGRVGKAILGSAAETVIEATSVPTTVVP
jgi:nucleotide-binding universal stress UspA family protein